MPSPGKAPHQFGDFNELVGIARRGEDHNECVWGCDGQPVNAGAVAALENTNTGSNFSQAPSHVIGHGVGQSRTNDVDVLGCVEKVHGFAHEIDIHRFV